MSPVILGFYSFMVSGCERLPNGNTFITEGATGRLFEVTPDGTKVTSVVELEPGGLSRLAAPLIAASLRREIAAGLATACRGGSRAFSRPPSRHSRP